MPVPQEKLIELQKALVDLQLKLTEAGVGVEATPHADEAVIAATGKFGSDVEAASNKTYVSLRRNKQFAIVQASTKTRVDLGLNLKGVESTERLEGGVVFGGICTHKVRLSEASEADEEVVSWLKQAYEAA